MYTLVGFPKKGKKNMFLESNLQVTVIKNSILIYNNLCGNA